MSSKPSFKKRYYPRLSSVISENDIPDILGFIKTGVINLLDNIYFKDLQYNKSPNGDSAFYGLSIVSPQRIDIEIPGTGIFLVLNPDLTDNNPISAFPITIEYQWKILAYLRFFSVGNFSFDPQQIFEVALRVLNVSEEQAIAHFINSFVEPADQDISSLKQFIHDLNELYPDWNLPEPNNETTLSQVVQNIFAKSGKYASLVAFSAYLLTDEIQETSAKVKVFFRSLIPQDIDEFIKEVIIPKFRATLLLSAAIEFPRSILIAVNREGTVSNEGDDISFDPIPDQKVILSFAEALFYADTQKGFGYNLDLVLNTNYPAQIGNTGLIIDIRNMKIDLSKTENIAEADADGRPKDFMGVYMEYTEIFLPKKWFKKNPDQTIGISANNLLVGTGGVSGNITIRATYKTKIVDNKTQVVSYYPEYFTLDYTSLKVYSMISPVLVQVHNESDLVAFMNSLESPSQLKFQYPIKLTTNVGQVLDIKSENEYYNFLKNLTPIFNETDFKSKFIWFDLGDHNNPDKKKYWSIGFQKFDIDFFQGRVVHSSLHAALEIKKFKKIEGNGQTSPDTLYVDIIGEWESKENFKLSASFLPKGLPLNLFNYLTLTLQTAELGNKDGNFYIEADTKLKFPDSGAFALFKGKEIDLPAIRIYSNGRFEIAGGIGFIPVNFTLPLGPVEMSVTGIHIGSVQKERDGAIRNYNYIGFDGSISVDPGGIEVRGNGIKYYYTVDNDDHNNSGHNYLHISTLEVDLVIPGTATEEQAVAIIKGSLTLPDPGKSDEFAGSVSIKLPQAKIAGEASMRLNPKNKSFLVKAAVEFPSPIIPLGFVGIYGFAGLIGKKYVADKKVIFGENADEKTWYDYYMAPEQGIGVRKFRNPSETDGYSNPFSIGMGASLATMADSGKTMSLRAMMLLSLPSMFAIDAGLSILSERLMLTDKRVPPFYAFIIIGDDSLEFGAGANYQINKTNGWFMDIKAEMQVGFFFKNQRPWYINFGTREKPITATIFKDVLNIKAESYLMISAAGIEAGARVAFDFDLYIARAWVMVEVGTSISFERPQIGGYMYIEGGAKLSFTRAIEVSIVVSIFFSVELVKPFLIFAQLRIQFRLKILFIKIKFNVLLTFKWEKNNSVNYNAIAPLTYQAIDDPDYSKNKNTEEYVKGIHMMTNEVFKIDLIDAGLSAAYPATTTLIKSVIPLDTFIDIKLEKGVAPSAIVDAIIGSHTGMANNFIDLIPPIETARGGLPLRQVKHKYSIEAVEIKMAVGNDWVTYNPYEALFDSDANIDVSTLKTGHWQINSDRYDTMRILATSPFSYMDAGEPGWMIPEQYGITPSTLFCTAQEEKWNVSNFLNIPLGTEYEPPTGFNAYMIAGAYYNIQGTYSQIIEVDEDGNSVQLISEDKMIVRNSPNIFGYEQSLEFGNGDNLIITFPESAARSMIKLATYSEGVTIKMYEKVLSNAIKPEYRWVKDLFYLKEDLDGEIEISDLGRGGRPLSLVSQIVISPKANNKDRIEAINQEIAAIWAEAASTATESGYITLTRIQSDLLMVLEQELAVLKQQACSDVGCSSLIFKVLDNVFVENFPLELLYFVNDENTFRNTLKELGYAKPLTVDFNKHSVLILCLTEYVADLGYVTNAVNKVINKKEHLCVNIEQESVVDINPNDPSESSRELPYIVFKYSVIQIEKMPSKNVIQDYNCGCSDDDDSNPSTAQCTTSIQEVRWLTMTEYEYQQTIPGQDAVNENAQSTMDAISKTIQPIWRPNTTYLLHFRLKDIVEFGKNSNSQIFYYNYGFKTMGPIGHFHKQNLGYLTYFENGEEKHYQPDEKAITSLRSYLDYKRSYPNPDGNLMGSKPLFYGNDQCKVDLFFDKAYLHHMFSDWKPYNGLDEIKMEMPVVIKDPVSEVIVPYPLPRGWNEEDVPGAIIKWEDYEDESMLPISIQNYIKYWKYVKDHMGDTIKCDINIGDIISPTVKKRTVTLTDLKPEKLYTAQVYGAYDADGNGRIEDQVDSKGKITYAEKQIIHEFGFITSQYKDFRQQVMSYNINETDETGKVLQTKQAVYNLPMELSANQINNLYALVSDNPNAETDALREKYIHEFDRALEGILKISPIHPPTNTDFVKIINSNNNDVVAILVRNPEPFNDPRIPLENMSDTLLVLDGKGSAARYKVLWNKDYSQAVIMNYTKRFDLTKNLSLQFIYKTWDGNTREYIVKTETDVEENETLYTVVTEPIIINQ